MKKNSLKLAQKGGMMIEALAMLGLIAVVTPTMYKKSAERTLEVEDINTATTMRSVMAAADSYVSSHYGELVQEMTTSETNKKTKKLNLDTDLKPYLPYGFNADKLYDFDKPQVSVVRNGNNLTAFVLFPAKEDGENGLGQERTVRIATLVGANGGYVNGDQTAKGIGGIWNLNKPDFQAVFGSTDASKPEVYSIVTASTDAINNTNTEEDSDKFLYRTANDGIWHNTMRADLYMGGNFNEHDGYDRSDPKSQPFSIRNIKSLIVGAATASDENTYGLYINGGTDNTNDAAFIKGSLEAAIPDGGVANFKATKDTIEADQGRFRIAENVLSYVGNIDLANGGKIDWNSVKIGKLGFLYTPLNLTSNNYLINGVYEGELEKASLSFIDRNVFSIETANENNDNIVINRDGIKGPGETGWTAEEYGEKKIKYLNAPNFPVRIGSNAKVDGILATSQLDTQNIRAATLEVGSAKIDNPNKWLNVDAGGIRVRDLSSGRDSDIDGDGVGTFIDVNDWRVKLKVSQGEGEAYLNLQDNDPGDGNDAILHADKIDINSGEAYLYLQNNTDVDGDGKEAILHADKIDIKNNTIQQQIKDNDVVFSSLQDSGYSTNVKIQKTNFEVSDTNGTVLAVRGNNEGDKLDYFFNMGIGDKAFDVSVRGETIFAPKGEKLGYLSVGIPYNEEFGPEKEDYAGVSIAPFNRDDEQILSTMAVDLSPESTISYGTGASYVGNSHMIIPGTVYVRNGMVEVMPTDEDFYMKTSTKGAHEGHGFMAAGRFVANNFDENGNEVKVPNFFEDSEYETYNGTKATNRYDTYMVNPAYTSVMHDIKLTTRGGARLSDILPDFINKGIYITSNTYQDDIKKMSFKFDTSSKKVVPAGTGDTAKPLSGSIVLGKSDSWASPYLGFVPAPQCPPGYNRVITMAPQSFMMAQAGQMQRGNNPRLGENGAYYVKNQVPDSTAFDNYTDTVMPNGAYVQQAFVKPSVSENSDVTINGTTYSGAAKTQGKEITGANGSTTAEYFLASFGDQTVPLTIQQSTWLKTNVIPVDNSGDPYSIGESNKKYTIGWAALMGFVYDWATYRTVIEKLSGDIPYNEGNTNVYWNVFPVRRNTLEAYATTYCYFDRNNIGDNWNTSSDFTSDKYIDHYNALTDYGNYTEKKNSNDSYKKRLNDPAMKYDEVW